ncbi:CPC cysteine peptidase, Clan CA, family C1, Cathepsin B [Pelomyxa schiedti]|nr:CPC cysteine peptidase, Clan CA, family C1, Cathepsin B [Pelomyxa schiedti]
MACSRVRDVTVVAGLVLVAAVSLSLCDNDVFVVTRDLVSAVNNDPRATWRASLDTPTSRLTRGEARKRLGGVDLTNAASASEQGLNAAVDLPESFDARQAWPQCETIRQIRDQSDCGSCWAFGSTEVFSDRECIWGGKTNLPLSVTDVLSCSDCGTCEGGSPWCAFEYWATPGVISEACVPYPLPGCDHHVNDSSNLCPTDYMYDTPECSTNCTVEGEQWIKYQADSKSLVNVKGEQAIMTEIYNNGPCTGDLSVYDDFLAYTGGVYQHLYGEYDGEHIIKFVGWGVENDVKYWIVANSWNSNWGEEGFFRILRGTNECGIDNFCYGAKPL